MVKSDEKVLQDLQSELENLEYRITGLHDFIYYEGQFHTLSLAEQCVFQAQLDIMQVLSNVLSARIELLSVRVPRRSDE